MKRRLLAAALACMLLAAAPARITVYSAPAGDRPAGAAAASNPYSLVLPNGRIVSPAGKSVVVGMQSLGVALSPDGKFAITTNDDEREGEATNHVDGARGGFSLAVVDTATMHLTDVFKSDTAN